MTDEEQEARGDIAVRTVLLFVPINLTASFLNLWTPKPLAWPVSMIAWMLLIYWLPTRASISLRRWLIIVSISTTIAFVVAILQPDLL